MDLATFNAGGSLCSSLVLIYMLLYTQGAVKAL